MSTDLVWRSAASVELDYLEIRDESTGEIERLVAAANRAAVEHARRRLGIRLSAAALTSLGAYFVAPVVHEWGGLHDARPRIALPLLLRELCSRVRSVAFDAKAQGLQVEFRSLGQPVDTRELGAEVEPESRLYYLSPDAVVAAARANMSVEVRLFDRQCPSWAALADDIAAVAGADVFLKLFLAGGTESVNGWHRDTSDVVVTVLDGAKRFEVGTFNSADDAPVSEVEVLLNPGDALLLPRSRLHRATPTGDVSALLSVGLMRYGDWSYRGASPTHMHLRNPRSQEQYRLALRSHVAPSWGPVTRDAVCRSRAPGGIGIIEHGPRPVGFVAAGQAFETTAEVLQLLTRIHDADGVTAVQLAVHSGRPESWCVVVMNQLAELGLIREDGAHGP